MQSETKAKFITTESLNKEGEIGERIVWEALKEAFKHRECLVYWRYPIFSQIGHSRKEPDILIADRELGLIVIEVKNIAIEQIVAISGHLWQYQNFYLPQGNPYQQAENQLFALLEYCRREPILHRQISARAMVALPQITSQQWQKRGFHQLPSSPPIFFPEHLASGRNIIEKIKQTPSLIGAKPLNSQQWQLLLAILAGNPLFCKPSRRVLAPDQSRGKILNQVNISHLDWQQEQIAKQIPPGLQRICGIAGSGKTVLLCQKAAHMHLKHPQWRIALVFSSRSLYQPIIEQIDLWLRRFSNHEQGYEPKNFNLRVCHGWGAKNQPGFYSILCRHAGVNRLTLNDTTSKKPHQALAQVCTQLLQTAAIPQVFDAILIDEGQDFLVDDSLKYGDKQPFYWLAYQALRPVNPIQPEQRRLIWADDSTQSLENLKIASAKELFGETLAHLVTGNHNDSIPKTAIIHRSYRTPHPILCAAHALGMGWLRPGGMLTGMTRLEDWQALGYQTTKNTPSSPQITLQRPLNNSPNPLPQLWNDELIEWQIYHSRQEELSALANNILHNMRDDGLRPSREILVLIVGGVYEAKKLETSAAEFLRNQGIDIYIPATSNYNLLQAHRDTYNPNQFWCEGAVTISRLHRAKGHEADFVYVLGLDLVAQDESNLYLRHQLYVALTRTRGWLYLSGIGNYPFYDEVQRVIKSRDYFSFPYRFPKREISVSSVGELLQRYQAGSRNFQHLNLHQAQLAGIDLRHANLMGANLQAANLQQTRLDAAKLIIADLSYANLTNANLQQAKLMGANLSYTNLNGANLQRADLSNANLTQTQLQGANLTGAILPESSE